MLVITTIEDYVMCTIAPLVTGVYKQWNGLLELWNSGMEIFESSFSNIRPKKPVHLHYFQHFCGLYAQNLTPVLYLMMSVSTQ